MGSDTTKEHAYVDHEYVPKMPGNDHSKRWSHTVLETVHLDFRSCLIMLVDSDIAKDALFLFCYGYNKDTKEGKYTSFVLFHTHNLKKI